MGLEKSEHCSDFKNTYVFLDAPLHYVALYIFTLPCGGSSFNEVLTLKGNKGNRRTSIGYCPHLGKSPLRPFQPEHKQ